MSLEPHVDIAHMAQGLFPEDQQRAMAESYAFMGLVLVAVLQTVGEIALSPGWEERAQGFVVVSDQRSDDTLRIRAVRRGEVPVMDAEQGRAVAKRPPPPPRKRRRR